MTRHSRSAGDQSQINQNSSAMSADHRSNCGRLVEIDRAWKETRRVIAVVSVCVSLMDKAAAAAAAAAVRAILNCRSDRAPKASRRRQACRSMSCRVAGHLRDYLPTHWRGVVAQWPGVTTLGKFFTSMCLDADILRYYHGLVVLPSTLPLAYLPTHCRRPALLSSVPFDRQLITSSNNRSRGQQSACYRRLDRHCRQKLRMFFRHVFVKAFVCLRHPSYGLP